MKVDLSRLLLRLVGLVGRPALLDQVRAIQESAAIEPLRRPASVKLILSLLLDPGRAELAGLHDPGLPGHLA